MARGQRTPGWLAIAAVGAVLTWVASIGWLVTSVDAADVEALDRELADMTMETTALLQQLESVAAERDDLREERDFLEARVADLTSELAEARAALRDAQATDAEAAEGSPDDEDEGADEGP